MAVADPAANSLLMEAETLTYLTRSEQAVGRQRGVVHTGLPFRSRKGVPRWCLVQRDKSTLRYAAQSQQSVTSLQHNAIRLSAPASPTASYRKAKCVFSQMWSSRPLEYDTLRTCVIRLPPPPTAPLSCA